MKVPEERAHNEKERRPRIGEKLRVSIREKIPRRRKLSPSDLRGDLPRDRVWVTCRRLAALRPPRQRQHMNTHVLTQTHTHTQNYRLMSLTNIDSKKKKQKNNSK